MIDKAIIVIYRKANSFWGYKFSWNLIILKNFVGKIFEVIENQWNVILHVAMRCSTRQRNVWLIWVAIIHQYLGPTKSVLIIKVTWFSGFQISLYDKAASFRTVTKCMYFQVSWLTGFTVSQNFTTFSQPQAELFYIPYVGKFVVGKVLWICLIKSHSPVFAWPTYWRPVYMTKIMRIDLNWLCPHKMCIKWICIECKLSQSTFWGGLNANCKWIAWTYVIISSQSISTRAHSICVVCVISGRNALIWLASVIVSISFVYKSYSLISVWTVEKTAMGPESPIVTIYFVWHKLLMARFAFFGFHGLVRFLVSCTPTCRIFATI